MITQALEISLLGMGFVFAYLLVLIAALSILKAFGKSTELEKVVAAIAFARKGGKNG